MRAKNEMIHMIVLGVGGWTDESELLAISSFPQSSNYIKVRNYDDLRNFAERMADYLCNSKCIPTPEITICATESVFPPLRLQSVQQWQIYIVKIWMPPVPVQFSSFLCSFGEIWPNNRLAPPFGESPSGKSWIRRW